MLEAAAIASVAIILVSTLMGALIAVVTIGLNTDPSSSKFILFSCILAVAISLVAGLVSGQIPAHPLFLLLMPMSLVAMLVGFRLAMSRQPEIKSFLEDLLNFG